MAETPLLSIVIPTRDRSETATICIDQVLAIPDRDIEVVVRDCGVGDEVQKHVAGIVDTRLVYERGEPASLTQNWNAALGLTRGAYVCFIGDDDGFLPWGVDAVRKLAPHGYDVISYIPYASYYWPNYPNDSLAGEVSYAPTREGPEQVSSSRANLLDYLRGKKWVQHPSIYHGLVSRDALMRVKERAGQVFQAQATDTFLSGMLAVIDAKQALLDYPLSVYGRSGKSNSAIYAKKDRIDLHSRDYAASDRTLHPLLPSLDSIATFVADSYLKAFAHAGDTEMLNAAAGYFLGATYAETAMRNPKRIPTMTKDAWRARGLMPPRATAPFIKGATGRLMSAVGGKLRSVFSPAARRAGPHAYQYGRADDIRGAIEWITQIRHAYLQSPGARPREDHR